MKDVLGIVLRERDYLESSKILDVLTKEYGLIGIISKGSKRIKSSLSSVSSKLTYGVFHIYYKEGKLSTLNSVDVIDPFINIKSDITSLSFAIYLLDLSYQVVRQTDKYEDIFNLLTSSILKINESFDPLVITNILELKYLYYLGVSPILDKCYKCGNLNNIITLSRNGLLCSKCRKSDKLYSLKSIKFIRMYYYLDISKITKIDIDNNIKCEIDDYLTEYYSVHTGLYLNSKDFINNLKRINVYV